MTRTDGALRVLFACPAYWPALAFGGPIWMARELTAGMVARGHVVDVVTTSLLDVQRPGSRHTSVREVDGVHVHYLATPLRYRWMGVTTSLPMLLARFPRPDVVHVFGFRDVVTTAVAAWCRVRRIPYVFEPLGMFKPKLRKVTFKQVFDATVARGVARGAHSIVATSAFEREEIVEAGGDPDRVVIRGNGFPAPASMPSSSGALRRRLGLADGEPVILYVGRIAAGKGIDHLLEATRALPDVHLALVGPDDAHGVMAHVREAQSDPATSGRVHVLESQGVERPLELYGDANVFVLPSAGESFGMVAAEAAAAGTPVVVTDRCGVADFLGTRGALVIPYDARAVRSGIEQVLGDPELASRLSAGALAAAEEHSWAKMVEIQERLYREAVASRA
jgi:glycosyltransferase involved in cell wall biosynthesis